MTLSLCLGLALDTCHAEGQSKNKNDYSFEGMATQDHAFSYEFAGGLVFNLIPQDGGFIISVFPKDHPEHDYSRVITPRSQLNISASTRLPPPPSLDLNPQVMPRLSTTVDSQSISFLFVRDEAEYADYLEAGRARKMKYEKPWMRRMASAAHGWLRFDELDRDDQSMPLIIRRLKFHGVLSMNKRQAIESSPK